jgi:pimeloyl-ACP methyl ester carboxylesterase
MKQLSRPVILMLLPVLLLACNHSSSTSTAKTQIHDQGVNIAYTDTGSGDTALLFVHGWCINKGYWSNQVAYFSKKYRVVAIDLPGFGESGRNRKDWSTTAFSQDIDSVISQLDLKNVILIGHSMAGDIVLQSAVDNPAKIIGLVGIDNFQGVGQPETAQGKKEFADAIAMLKHNFKAVAFSYFNQDLFLKTTPEAIKKRVLNDVAHTDTTIAVAAMEQGNDFNEVAKLKQAKTKLYLINSDFHTTDTTGLIANKLPYRLLIIHGTGHFPMIEEPEKFNVLLEQVIADISANKK